MAYGLECWDSNGKKTLSVTDQISRFRYSIVANANNNGSVTLNDIDGKKTCQFGIALESGLAHIVSRSGTTISWNYQSGGTYGYPSSDTLILVFLYT